MNKITYHPGIPTSRKVVPSQYQRMRRTQGLIVTWDEFMDALQNIADSLNRAMGTE